MTTTQSGIENSPTLEAWINMTRLCCDVLESCEISTGGECSVRTSSCVAGDWFTSDAAGLAVKTETGFALGRILADPVDGLALCVVGPLYLA